MRIYAIDQGGARCQAAAEAVGAPTPMGARATELYDAFVEAGGGTRDFSAILPDLEGKSRA